jgi:hypothetical protein
MANQIAQACLDACNACADACDRCSTACLQEQDVKMMARCIALDMGMRRVVPYSGWRHRAEKRLREAAMPTLRPGLPRVRRGVR